MAAVSSMLEAETASEFTSDTEDPRQPLADEQRLRAGRFLRCARVSRWTAVLATVGLAAYAAYAHLPGRASLLAAGNDVVALAEDENTGTNAENATIEVSEDASVTDYIFMSVAPSTTSAPASTSASTTTAAPPFRLAPPAKQTSAPTQQSVLPPSVCRDTEGWTNKYNCREELFLESDGCSEDGWTCYAYELKGWCKDGVALKSEFSFAFQDTDSGINKHEELNDPSLNCCVCGKPKGVVGEAPGGNGIGTPFFP